MSVQNRGRFKPDAPFPEGGVVTPNVFPSQIQGHYGQLNLHDILDGRIPQVKPGQHPKSGWLRIVDGNGITRDYSSPHMSEAEHQTAESRRTVEIGIDIEQTSLIKRVSTTLVQAALQPPKFDGSSFVFPGAKTGKLIKQVDAEQAVAFSGVASIQGTETIVGGIHFDSGKELGWIFIGEEPPLLDSPA